MQKFPQGLYLHFPATFSGLSALQLYCHKFYKPYLRTIYPSADTTRTSTFMYYTFAVTLPCQSNSLARVRAKCYNYYTIPFLSIWICDFCMCKILCRKGLVTKQYVHKPFTLKTAILRGFWPVAYEQGRPNVAQTHEAII